MTKEVSLPHFIQLPAGVDWGPTFVCQLRMETWFKRKFMIVFVVDKSILDMLSDRRQEEA